MTGHPCDGHACDHCYLCDVVGVCCSTVPAADREAVAEEHQARERFRAAIASDAEARVSLTRLVHLDAASSLSVAVRTPEQHGSLVPREMARPVDRMALPAAEDAHQDIESPNKERIHVVSSRTAR